MLRKKILVASAVRFRLLFSTYQEAQTALVVKLKTWMEVEEETGIEEVFKFFNHISENISGESLQDRVSWLIEASKIYSDLNIWKGKRE